MPRILVVAPNWIGDALLAQPLFARLRERTPGLVLDALAPAWTAPVLARMPQIDTVIEAPFGHGELALGRRWRLARELAARGYERAIVLPNSLKSALVPWFAGIARRVGYVGESRYLVLNVRHALDEQALPLMAERYAKLAEPPDAAPVRPLPTVRLEVDEANLLITVARLGLDRSRPIAALCPGAEFGPAKRWPAAHFAALARALDARGAAVWLIGSAKDRALGDEITELARGAARNLCGRTDLGAAIDLMSVAAVVVSNDSGLMHVAAALGRPLVALYGASSPDHTPPLAPAARILKLDVECSPCYARECPLGHFRCMNELAPELVLTALAPFVDAPHAPRDERAR
ncbi:MAG: lipopolysaccharide heptosyltransferase II [Burkholderiales bacterium]|nr:lipopolysaccharide heptosyltransferase II [Burkholderiales bacterium]